MMKRTLNDKDQKNLSPPPVRRKVESTTTSEIPRSTYLSLAHSLLSTEKAVASFFTPASKKEPDLITWRTVDNSLLVGRYKGPPPRRRKIAAFDFVCPFFLSISRHPDITAFVGLNSDTNIIWQCVWQGPFRLEMVGCERPWQA